MFSRSWALGSATGRGGNTPKKEERLSVTFPYALGSAKGSHSEEGWREVSEDERDRWTDGDRERHTSHREREERDIYKHLFTIRATVYLN